LLAISIIAHAVQLVEALKICAIKDPFKARMMLFTMDHYFNAPGSEGSEFLLEAVFMFSAAPEAFTHMRTLKVSEEHWKRVLHSLKTALDARAIPQATAAPQASAVPVVVG
jgi:uncharacterized protein (DUF1778 family)